MPLGDAYQKDRFGLGQAGVESTEALSALSSLA